MFWPSAVLKHRVFPRQCCCCMCQKGAKIPNQTFKKYPRNRLFWPGFSRKLNPSWQGGSAWEIWMWMSTGARRRPGNFGCTWRRADFGGFLWREKRLLHGMQMNLKAPKPSGPRCHVKNHKILLALVVNKPISKPLSLLQSTREDKCLWETHFLHFVLEDFYFTAQASYKKCFFFILSTPLVSIALEGYNSQRLLNEIIPPVGGGPSGSCQTPSKQRSRLEPLWAA